jgi:hypothetical protein
MPWTANCLSVAVKRLNSLGGGAKVVTLSGILAVWEADSITIISFYSLSIKGG